MIGLSTLSTGILRVAVLSAPSARKWSAATVVLWGLIGSLTLALFYVPARKILNSVGDMLKHRINPEPSAGASRDEVVSWYETDDKLGKLLRLGFTDWSSISGGLGTLAPLFLGWIASLLK
jgi:hypothetical protein